VLSLDQTLEAASGGRDADDTARALGVGFVVEGGLRRSGQTLDVEVSLVEAGGTRRPAGRYTSDMAQMFDLHQRIAQGIIATIAETNAGERPASPSPAPTLNQEAFAEYAQARLFLDRADDADHAIRLFQSAIAKDPRFALAHAGLGQAYWAKYAHTSDPVWTTKAVASILEGLLIDPNQPEVRLSLAVMHQGLGRSEAAEEEVRRVIAAQPWNDDAHRLLGGIHIDRGEWDAAVQELTQAIDLRPNYWRNHTELGYTHYRAGRLDESVKAYERAVQLAPDSTTGFFMLGTVHQSAGRLEQALANYEKANAILPKHTVYSNIGTIHFWNGDYAKAADAYARGIELTPNEPALHANLGDALRKLGQRARATASYRTAVDEVRQQLAINGQDALNVSLLALYLAKLGEWPDADAASAKALSLAANDGEVLYNAAMVDALAGRSTEACVRLGGAVEQGITSEIVRRTDELRGLKGCETYDRIVSPR
jgi:tetratricopeptide (TPR) repeat protein